MTEKLIAAALIVVACILGLIAFDPLNLVDFDFKNGLTRRTGFVAEVSEDFAFMKKKKLLPKEWASIQYTAYNFHTDLQRQLVGHKKFDIPETPQGRYRLEIEFIDVPDENPSLILQMSLFDIASTNKVWEMGRTYGISHLLKKEKAVEKTTTEGSSNSSEAPAAAGAENNNSGK